MFFFNIKTATKLGKHQNGKAICFDSISGGICLESFWTAPIPKAQSFWWRLGETLKWHSTNGLSESRIITGKFFIPPYKTSNQPKLGVFTFSDSRFSVHLWPNLWKFQDTLRVHEPRNSNCSSFHRPALRPSQKQTNPPPFWIREIDRSFELEIFLTKVDPLPAIKKDYNYNASKWSCKRYNW